MSAGPGGRVGHRTGDHPRRHPMLLRRLNSGNELYTPGDTITLERRGIDFFVGGIGVFAHLSALPSLDRRLYN